ncbi:hypothetical protein PB1_02520 [Bacillus methanolicus PB1]|uniref:Uncharacterized protein n=1 Tax=Bacillus methanolicus PB1 TaxID=997296 RepID=I3E5K6_BACMT|nr:hypothetical protein PB1_02520 [Bacillus methanolicus PB1]
MTKQVDWKEFIKQFIKRLEKADKKKNFKNFKVIK